jgi:hypothetical protein
VQNLGAFAAWLATFGAIVVATVVLRFMTSRQTQACDAAEQAYCVTRGYRQVVAHPGSSPPATTWRRCSFLITGKRPMRRPTTATTDTWQRTVSSSRLIAARSRVQFGCWLSVSFLGSLAAGALVRHQLATWNRYWIVTPELSIQPDQNLNWPLPLAVIGAVVSGLALSALALAIARAAPGSSGLLLAVLGIGAGGIFANAAEALTIGSVTDFLAIRASGVFSAGDIAYLTGGALLPIALDRATRNWLSNLGRAALASSALVLVGVAALRMGNEPLVVVIEVAAIASAGLVSLVDSLAGRHRAGRPASPNH